MEGFYHSQPDGSASSQFLYDAAEGTQGVINRDTYPLEGVTFPGMNDVMCGRGGATNNHIGNIRFRQLVNEHKRRYLAASKVDKPRVALEVVKIWRGLDPPGRFLTKTHAALGEGSPWHDVGDKKAREKASQCLRERTPDVIPFVKQLEQQEKRKKKDEEAAAAAKTALPEKVPSTLKRSNYKVDDDAPNLKSETEDNVVPLSLSQQDSGNAQPRGPQRKSKTRQEFASTIPTGEALTQVVFSDDADAEVVQDIDGQEFNEDYQRLLSDLAQSAAKNASPADEEARPPLAKTQSAYSWMKSFKSIDSAFSAMETSAYSMRDTAQEGNSNDDGGAVDDEEAETIDQYPAGIPEDSVEKIHPPEPAAVQPVTPAQRTENGRKARPRMVNAAYGRDSQMSIMSDLSSRSLMMGHAADQASKRSVLSAMSDMTELSDALKDMDLSSFAPPPPR